MTEIIPREAYLQLPDEEKKNWVLITPTASDPELAASIDLVGDEQKILEMLEPIQSKAIMIPNPLPGEQLSKALDTIETMTKALDPIKALTGVPIIGALAAPVVNLINKVFEMIGMLLMMIMMLTKGQELLTDSICKAVDEMDWDGLKEAVDNLKKKYEDMKQKASDAMNSESTDTNGIKRKMSDTASKVMEKIDAETKAQVESIKAATEACYNSVLAADAGARAIKIVKEVQLQQYSWESLGKKIISAAGKLGVDFSPLNAPSEAQMKAFEESFPNPSAVAFKVNSAINVLNKKKYMKIEEKKVIVDDEKKIETTPKPTLSDNLSPHFTISDLIYSDTARRRCIDNTPPNYVVENLRLLANNVLEKIYSRYGSKIKINSCYRGPALNACIGGKSKSQHTTGQAVDIEINGLSNFDFAVWIKDNCDYDQLILENARADDPTAGWVHVSYKSSGNRRQLLTIAHSRTYAGLSCPTYCTKYA